MKIRVGIINLFFVIFLFSCSSITSNVPLDQLESSMKKHSLGYLKLHHSNIHHEQKQNLSLMISQSELGKQYLKCKGYNKNRTMVFFELTQKALDEGGFVSNDNHLYIPIGEISYKIVDQTIHDMPMKMGQVMEVKAKYQVELSPLGRHIQGIIDEIEEYRKYNAKLKTEGVFTANFSRKNDSQEWKSGSNLF